MNVLINKESMVFLRRMENHSTLSKLADIECPHIAVAICFSDKPEDFSQFTDLELKLLIANSNGPDVRHTFSRDVLLKTVHAIAAVLPVTVADAFQVDLQLRSIPEGDKNRYLFVPGGTKPKLAEGLAELVALQAGANAVKQAATHATATPQGVAVPAAEAAASGDFVRPREGTSTFTIFSFCANLWKESGYTESKSTLDNIRKKAVDSLVPTGLNISTVRTQAARWYQHRQRFVI